MRELSVALKLQKGPDTLNTPAGHTAQLSQGQRLFQAENLRPKSCCCFSFFLVEGGGLKM